MEAFYSGFEKEFPKFSYMWRGDLRSLYMNVMMNLRMDHPA